MLSRFFNKPKLVINVYMIAVMSLSLTVLHTLGNSMDGFFLNWLKNFAMAAPFAVIFTGFIGPVVALVCRPQAAGK